MWDHLGKREKLDLRSTNDLEDLQNQNILPCLISKVASVLVAIAIDALCVVNAPLITVVVRLGTGVDAQTLHILDTVN